MDSCRFRVVVYVDTVLEGLLTTGTVQRISTLVDYAVTRITLTINVEGFAMTLKEQSGVKVLVCVYICDSNHLKI